MHFAAEKQEKVLTRLFSNSNLWPSFLNAAHIPAVNLWS